MPKNALCRKEFTNKDLGLQVRTITNEDGSYRRTVRGMFKELHFKVVIEE